MKKIIFTSLFAGCFLWLAAQNFSSKISPYSAFFLQNYQETKNDSLSVAAFAKEFGVKKANSLPYINCFLQLKDTFNLNELREHNILINTVLSNIITAQVPVNEFENISALEQVKCLEVATPARLLLEEARMKTNVDLLHSGVELPRHFTGKGVVVGIIDKGFEYGHINFFDSAGVDLRVRRVWNQNDNKKYTTKDEILAAGFDNFVGETHGTHVAGIAAGGYKGNRFYGVAPAADIVLVTFDENDNSANNVSILNGIKYVYDYANSQGKPAVVNLSLGYHLGAHDGTSLFDIACDELQGRGKLLVGSVGNEGNDTLHLEKHFAAATDTLRSFIHFFSSTEKKGWVDIWGAVERGMKVQAVIFQKSTGKIVEYSAFVDGGQTSTKTLNFTKANGSAKFYAQKNDRNKKPNVFVSYTFASLSNDYALGFKIVADNGTRIHAWVDDQTSTFTNNGVAGWEKGNNNFSASEIGGTGKRIIAVGAFNSKNVFKNLNNITRNYTTTFPLNQISYFSSMGPTADGRTKPDITAPGAILISSFSSTVANISNEYYGNITEKITQNGKNYYFGAMQGTSMAAPFVTGVLATWLEIEPHLSPEMLRDIFKETATHDNFTGEIAENGSNLWGYGKIDALAGAKKILNLLAAAPAGSEANIALTPNPCQTEMSVYFKYDDSNVELKIYDLNANVLVFKQLGNIYEGKTIYLNEVSNLLAGTYILHISGGKKSYGRKFVVKK